MAGRLYVFPYELLIAWQRAHPSQVLTAAQQEAFVKRPICQEIGAYPTEMVHSVLRRRARLTEVLDELRRLEAARTAAAQHGVAGNVGPTVIKRPSAPPRSPGRADGAPRPENSDTTSSEPGKPRVTRLPDGAITRPSRMTPLEKQLAAEARLENPSDAERLLWARLKDRQRNGFLFVREHRIDGWWVDFYCSAGRLVVEVDGHHHAARLAEDNRRDEFMRAYRYRVIRFPARRVFTDMDGVLAEIDTALDTGEARRRRGVVRRSTNDGPSAPTPERPPTKATRKVPHPTSDAVRPATGLYFCKECNWTFPHAVARTVACNKCRLGATPVCRGCGRKVDQVSDDTVLCQRCTHQS
jgi:very-short-patch-repair endonuclease/DNA-directed RNA polymerase subunit RPC12/RpoP